MKKSKHEKMLDGLIKAIEEAEADPHTACEVVVGWLAGVISAFSTSENELERTLKITQKTLKETATQRYRARKAMTQ